MVKVNSKSELERIIGDRMKTFGPNCDLNDIDVSEITDMSYLFDSSNFNGNISQWDVSNVTSMKYMFSESQFNGDISNWDVSKVTSMKAMFYEAQFNSDISQWNVSSVTDMIYIFSEPLFNGDISRWNIDNLKWGKEDIQQRIDEYLDQQELHYRKLEEENNDIEIRLM